MGSIARQKMTTTAITISPRPSMLIARATFETGYLIIGLLLFAQVESIDVAIQPVYLFILCTVMGMAAGLASLWRGAEEVITGRLVVSHVLNMGTCGAALSMILYAMLAPRANLEWYILGGVGLFSLGGMTAIEMVVGLGAKLVSKIVGGESDGD